MLSMKRPYNIGGLGRLSMLHHNTQQASRQTQLLDAVSRRQGRLTAWCRLGEQTGVRMSAHGSVREQVGACQSQRVPHGETCREIGNEAGFNQGCSFTTVYACHHCIRTHRCHTMNEQCTKKLLPISIDQDRMQPVLLGWSQVTCIRG